MIIFELLMGRLPYEGANAQMTALAHVDQPVPRARDFNKAFPRSIEAVMVRALAKDPNNRYQTAEELRQAYYDAVKELSEDDRRACYWEI